RWWAPPTPAARSPASGPWTATACWPPSTTASASTSPTSTTTAPAARSPSSRRGSPSPSFSDGPPSDTPFALACPAGARYLAGSARGQGNRRRPPPRAFTHQRRSTMSPFRSARVASLVVALGLALPAAPGQEGDKDAPPKAGAAAQVSRQVYVLRGGSAKDLAAALT